MADGRGVWSIDKSVRSYLYAYLQPDTGAVVISEKNALVVEAVHWRSLCGRWKAKEKS